MPKVEYLLNDQRRPEGNKVSYIPASPPAFLSHDLRRQRPRLSTENEKADVGEHFEMHPHVGLLYNEPPGKTGLLFI